MAEEQEKQSTPVSPATGAPQATPPTTETKPAGGYGKRPMWQWIVIYLVLAVIIYGVVYYLFFHKSSSSGSKSIYFRPAVTQQVG